MTKIDTTKETGQTFYPNWSDWSGKLIQNAKWTSQFDSSCRVDQDSYVEHPIWSPDEGDMTSGRSAPRTDRSDQFAGAVRPVLVCRIRIQVVFWHGNYQVFDPIRSKTSPPYIYKGPRAIEVNPIDQNISIYYFSLLFVFLKLQLFQPPYLLFFLRLRDV